MSSRAEFVALARAEGANVRSLCRRFGISTKTGYKWLRRAVSGGDAPLSDRSRRPTGAWELPLAVGQPLPTLPIWLAEDLHLKLDLDPSYEKTCSALRPRGM